MKIFLTPSYGILLFGCLKNEERIDVKFVATKNYKMYNFNLVSSKCILTLTYHSILYEVIKRKNFQKIKKLIKIFLQK